MEYEEGVFAIRNAISVFIEMNLVEEIANASRDLDSALSRRESLLGSSRKK